jgi:hypothetical protein
MRVTCSVLSKAKLVAVALLLVSGLASQASAGTITATFKGTVQAAMDTTGVFGTPGANLAGAAYSLVYTVNPALGAYSTFNGPVFDPLLSGDQIFGGNSAVLTINGHGYSFVGAGSPGGNYDIAASKPGFAELGYSVSNTGQFSQVQTFLSSTNPGSAFPASVFAAVAINSCPPGSCTFIGGFLLPTSSVAFLSGTLNFGTFTVVTTPIPAALPLLVSALGSLGFVGWRRRNAEGA